MEKQRIDYLDAAKSLAILCVALSFCIKDGIAGVVLAAVTMPLLFFASGVFISRHRHSYNAAHWLEFLLHNVKGLIVPYFVFALIYGTVSLDTAGKIFYGSAQMLETVQPILWYLPCLFAAKLLCEVFLMLSVRFEKIDRRIVSGIGAVISFAVGFLLPKIEMGYPFGLNIAFVALGFMLAGYTVKDYLSDIVARSAGISFVVMLLCGGFFALSFLSEGSETVIPDMGMGEYGQVFMFLLRAFFGIGCLLALSLLITGLITKAKFGFLHRFLIWQSRNAIRIYLLLPLSFLLIGEILTGRMDAGFLSSAVLFVLSYLSALLFARIIGFVYPMHINTPDSVKH